jgi:uroporphyrinogen decarboxylase
MVTDFLVKWIAYQRECFPTIDGVLMLDDIVGFVSKKDFEKFGLPYLKKAYDVDVAIKFFHNDAPCKASASYLPEVGINLLNFGVQHTLNDMKTWTENKVTLLGNLPPRDVLANGTPDQVKTATTEMLASLEDRTRLIFSCGGGMPPGVSTENIQACLEAVREFS